VAAVTRLVFQYAALRAVPRVDRGDAITVGVVLYCQDADFLGTAARVDADRLRCLDPDVDVDGLVEALDALQRTCAGEGPAATTTLGQRFRWLTSPRSTVLQPGAAHSGFTSDPATELARLLAHLTT
jgi:hypothetical protein